MNLSTANALGIRNILKLFSLSTEIQWCPHYQWACSNERCSGLLKRLLQKCPSRRIWWDWASAHSEIWRWVAFPGEEGQWSLETPRAAYTYCVTLSDTWLRSGTCPGLKKVLYMSGLWCFREIWCLWKEAAAYTISCFEEGKNNRICKGYIPSK